MGERRWIVGPALLVVLALLLVLVRHDVHASAAGREGRRIGVVTPAEQAATFTFGPTVGVTDRSLILAAVASARPEARRLIDEVDGLVDVNVVVTPEGAAGLTQSEGARYRVDLDLGLVYSQLGRRGVDRLVLHELGHVVDFALVPVAMRAHLDAGIPAGYGCDDGVSGSCANAYERFAETFAKWAMNDIGVDLDIGYKVPPPPSLDAWGAPLAALSPAA